MKKIYNIAKTELYSLFYSPIAWLLMILFLVLTAADYIDTLDYWVRTFQTGGEYLAYVNKLTYKLIKFGIYLQLIDSNLFMLFPLITMGLISREVGNGTIKLLYSSPVRIREIVLGKFLAILAFICCLILLICLLMVSLSISVVHADYLHLFTSLFGTFLVLATYGAIGLFISSLTSYQIVAAIITMGVYSLLYAAKNLWQEIDVVRNITYYFNLGGKSANLINGLPNLRDISYFIILILTFLSFTIIKLRSGMESISWPRKAMRYSVVIIVAFVAGYITSRPKVNIYVDVTRDQVHTITPPTQAMLARLNDGELKIKVFANLLDRFGRFRPAEQNAVITDQLERYIRFKPDIDVKFAYYYDQDTGWYYFKRDTGKTIRQIAQVFVEGQRMDLGQFLSPDEANKQVDTKHEEFRNFFQLEYKGKKTIVRTFDDNVFWPLENEWAAGINRLIATPPKIGFLCDEIERSPFAERTRDYKLIASQIGNREALINQGYDFDTVSLKNLPAVPSDLAALVIADPRVPISQGTLEKINRYIDAGGNLLITCEPDRKEILQPLLDKLGLSLRDGLLIQPSNKYPSNAIFTYLTDTAANLSPQFARQISDTKKYLAQTNFDVVMEGASAMEYKEKDGFKVDPLLMSDMALSWNRLAPVSNDSLQTKVGGLPSDERGRFVTAVRMSRTVHGKDQRIIVASDADYLSKPQLYGRDPSRYNYDFGFWCFSQFGYGQFPANTLRPESLDNAFRIKANNIPLQKLIFYWIIPILIGIGASVILIRRKRK